MDWAANGRCWPFRDLAVQTWNRERLLTALGKGLLAGVAAIRCHNVKNLPTLVRNSLAVLLVWIRPNPVRAFDGCDNGRWAAAILAAK